jgi:DNA polymerase I
MGKKLFLLDGMALVYRAHFALISRPIFSSKGVNTSALYGFTQTLLEILKNQQPTHIAVALDTEAPTHRHKEFAEYKATRQAMPEDLSEALPHVRRMIEAFRIPLLECDGYEADDIIGTVVRRAEREGFKSYMVTPDKDFGQLVDENTFLYKPSRMGDGVEVMGLPEIRQRWGIERAEQVVDVLALMGDTSDNIPGVPGIGEKTAIKLVGQFGTVENLLARTSELKGRQKDSLEQNAELARVSKRLATILCDAPCPVDLETLKLEKPDDEKLKALFVEFEFNSIGRRLFGEEFKAGRGFASGEDKLREQKETTPSEREPVLEFDAKPAEPEKAATPSAPLKRINDVMHEYRVAATPGQRAELIQLLRAQPAFGFQVDASSSDAKSAKLEGLGFAWEPHRAFYVPVPPDATGATLEEFRHVLSSEAIEKVGHDLKFDLSVLKWHGLEVRGKLFDTMVAHSLIEPDLRHSIDYVSEMCLGYSPAGKSSGEEKELNLPGSPGTNSSDRCCELVDVAWQLRTVFEPMLKEKGQERVFYEVEAPLVGVLMDMEYEGIQVDAKALGDFGAQLAKEIDEQEKAICQLAGTTFNLNSPKQLGQILFDVMKICAAPKKTKSGQYSTDEQTLLALAPDHEVVRRLLDHRAATKLKSTYADALPTAIWPRTGRVHTTYNQVMTATGRLNSQDPNLQNIPIRTERGQEIRKAFVPRSGEYLLLSADYSQIELRIIAALSREAGLLEAFKSRADVHTATAAKVFGVFPEMVTAEMRRKAKMVNYGIAYGISAFGLAQRLAIPRREAAEIIDQYFKQFQGLRQYMDETIEFARKHGYVETVTGRRRYLRDVRSSNNTVRSAAERNAINAPIQGTAADMIKLAMIRIHQELVENRLKTRMLLQVHDELVFDLYKPEEQTVRALVEANMKNAIKLEVPIEVEMGVGKTWLEAH